MILVPYQPDICLEFPHSKRFFHNIFVYDFERLRTA